MSDQEAQPPAGMIEGRRFEAHPSVHTDGTVAWWLVDDTDHQLTREALHMEQERTVRQGNTVALKVTSAGHPPPLIVRADGTVEVTDTRGTLVGAVPRISSCTAAVTLAVGDACVLYTDGITEAKGGPLGDTLFGEERLKRALSKCAGMPAEGIAEHIQMLASQWLGSRRHDDMAVVVISAPRTRHLSALPGHTRGGFTR